MRKRLDLKNLFRKKKKVQTAHFMGSSTEIIEMLKRTPIECAPRMITVRQLDNKKEVNNLRMMLHEYGYHKNNYYHYFNDPMYVLLGLWVKD